MERQQDVNLWTANALYVAANGVLLIAIFGSDLLGFRWAVPVVGIAIAVAWLMTSTRAHQYEKHWAVRARTLESSMEIPPDYRVWDEERLKGIPAKFAEYGLIYFFAALWISFAGFLSGWCLSVLLTTSIVVSTLGLLRRLIYIFKN